METLRKNSRGESVKLMQEILNFLGYGCGKADGVFGKNTFRAVKAFQVDRGIGADGVAGPETWRELFDAAPESVCEKIEPAGTDAVPSSLSGAGNAAERAPVRPPDFKQYNKRWADKMYSSHGDKKQTLRSSGCGPTAMADVVAALIDSTVTPPLLADKAISWGDRSRSNGTAWSFFKHAAREYAFGRYLKTGSKTQLLGCLAAGGLAVASMGKGYWTKGGHYICVWKADGAYIYANDPASAKREKQRITDFMNERKAFFCFWK